MTGFKTMVSAAANLPAAMVSVTKDVVADLGKSTQALYEKAVDKVGVIIDQVPNALSAVGEFVSSQAPMILGVTAGLLTTGACMASTLGVGTPACIVAGFAVGGAVNSALSCAPGRSVVGCAARGGAAGTVAGLITVSTGGMGSGVAGVMFSGAASSAGENLTTQLLENGSVDVGELVTHATVGGATGGLGRGAGKFAKGLRCSRNSFVPGTRVLMADGSTKSIEDVAVGDLVLATDPTTGKTSAKPVTDLIAGSGEKHLVSVTVESETDAGQTIETITATDGHPFWVDGNGASLDDHRLDTASDSGRWADAGDLRAGDLLHTPRGGGTATVLDTRTRTELRTVYNLTVDGIHTYYIQTGDTDVLVHNACSPSETLGKAMTAVGVVRPAETSAHHIVAFKARGADAARRHVDNLGMNLNDPRNGVFLPSNKNSSSIGTGRAIHASLHTKKYYSAVNDIVTGARNLDELSDVLGYISGRLEGGGFP
jgi:hypothetical protein